MIVIIINKAIVIPFKDFTTLFEVEYGKRNHGI
jgi:hypothetical protein